MRNSVVTHQKLKREMIVVLVRWTTGDGMNIIGHVSQTTHHHNKREREREREVAIYKVYHLGCLVHPISPSSPSA